MGPYAGVAEAARALRCRYTLRAFPPIGFMGAGGSSGSIATGATPMDVLIYLGAGLALFALASTAVLAADRL